MKNALFLFFIITFYCVCFFSCKEKANRNEEKHVFIESYAEEVVEDSLQLEARYSLELNVGNDIERGAWQNPELVIRKLGNLENKVVADIGSGTGYFTFPISRKAEKVLAIDIEQRYLDYIEDRKLELPIDQAEVIETRLTVPDEPNLHANEVDAVLLVNVYYYLDEREDYMKIVHNALKENGILVLVDYFPGELPVGPSDDKPTPNEVVTILKQSGFEEIDVDKESLQYQYIITASR